MATIRLKVYVPETREVEIKLPEDFPVGETEVVIEVPNAKDVAWEERPWTEAEIRAFLTFRPSTLGEILDAGLVGIGAEDMKHIGDSATWVEDMRRKEEERYGKWTLS